MGLLNKSNKTKTILTIGDISKKIEIRIVGKRESNMTPDQKAFHDELLSRVRSVGADLLHNKWTTDTVPTMSLEYTKELMVTGEAVQDQYIFFFHAYSSNSSISYKIYITLDAEKMNGISPRVLQGGFIRNGKWECSICIDDYKNMTNGASK